MSFLKIYPIIILGVLLLANILPKHYEHMFSKRVTTAEIAFSPVKEEFIKVERLAGKERKKVRSTLDGKETFTEEEYQALFPFIYYSNLLGWDKFPKKFEMYKDNISIITNSSQWAFMHKPSVNDKPVGLYPLFESASKFNDLVLPDAFFRLKNSIEFINSETNKVDSKQSNLFKEALLKKGLHFPIQKAFGNPSTMKPFDEGYFLIDATKQLFHMKQKQGMPVIQKIDTKGIDIKYISIVEDKRKEFYGLVLDQQDSLYLLMYDDYELVKIPVAPLDGINSTLVLKTNPMYRYFTFYGLDEEKGANVISLYVTDLDYELVDQNIYEYPNSVEGIYKTAKSILFPFILELTKDDSYKYSLEIKSFSLNGFLFNLVMVLFYFIYIRLSRRALKVNVVNVILISIGGVYSLISIFAFHSLTRFSRK